MSAPALPAIDLFAGAGGLSCGLAAAGFSAVSAVELAPTACATYAALHPSVDVIEADIGQLSFRELRGNIALVAGGPPCQPFSTGGLRRGAADRRDGFPHFLRAVREVSPDAVLIENVSGLAKGPARPYLDSLLCALADLGYVVTWRTLAATDFGVPQRRERLFIVASRRPGFAFPQASHRPGGPVPWVPSGSVLSKTAAFGVPNAAIVTYAKRPDLRPSPYDGLLFNGGGRPIDLAKPARTILASAGGNKTPFVDTLDVVPAYHAHLMRGGPPRRGRVPGARRISVAEAAALQTFPPGTTFAGPISMQYTLVGNAVPPKLAEAVAVSLRHHFVTSARPVRAA